MSFIMKTFNWEMGQAASCLSLKPRLCMHVMWFNVYPLTGEPTFSSHALSKHSWRPCAISLLCERNVRTPPNEAKRPSTLRGKLLYTCIVIHCGSNFCPLSRNAGCPLNQGLFIMGVYGEMKRVWHQVSTSAACPGTWDVHSRDFTVQ